MSIARNTAYNLLGSAIPLVVSLVTIPIYISLIGEARYGVLAIAWLLLGYFGLFDLGLGYATAQRIAVMRDAPAAERAQTFWTALTLNVGLGIVGGLLMWPIASYFFGNVFKVEEPIRQEVLAVVPWLMLAVPMATLTGVLTGALQGRERFLELNLISVTGTVLFQLLPLSAAMLWRVDLGIILPVVLAVRLITVGMLFERCHKHLVCNQEITFVRAQAGQLLRFGGWVTVTSFVGPLMSIVDRFVIGSTVGAKAVTYYTVPLQLAERSSVIPVALTSAMFPRFAASTLQEERRLAFEGLRILAIVMTPLVAAGILLMDLFLAWWITPAFAKQSSLIGQIVLIGIWANGFARVPLMQLQARGRPDLVAKCHLAELLPYFGLLYLGLTEFGLVGAATAFTIRVIVDFFLLALLAGVLRPSRQIMLIPILLLGTAILIGVQNNLDRTQWLVFVLSHMAITIIWALWQTLSHLNRSLKFPLTPPAIDSDKHESNT